MIKLAGRGERNGKPRNIVLLGLEEMNVVRLREGRPIHINGEEMGFPASEVGLEIIIVLGKDTDSLREQFSELIGPDTVVRDHRTEKKQ